VFASWLTPQLDAEPVRGAWAGAGAEGGCCADVLLQLVGTGAVAAEGVDVMAQLLRESKGGGAEGARRGRDMSSSLRLAKLAACLSALALEPGADLRWPLMLYRRVLLAWRRGGVVSDAEACTQLAGWAHGDEAVFDVEADERGGLSSEPASEGDLRLSSEPASEGDLRLARARAALTAARAAAGDAEEAKIAALRRLRLAQREADEASVAAESSARVVLAAEDALAGLRGAETAVDDDVGPDVEPGGAAALRASVAQLCGALAR